MYERVSTSFFKPPTLLKSIVEPSRTDKKAFEESGPLLHFKLKWQ
jgi:hypothetical protein